MSTRYVVLLALLCFLPASVDTDACGTIDTTDATIQAGAAPSSGTVVVDPCMTGGTPPNLAFVGSLPPMGAMPGSMPSFPGGGTGVDGAFDASVDQTLPAGPHNFTTFRIQDNVTVTATGPVTIKTTGTMTINGKLVSTAAAAAITIHCGGALDAIGPYSGMAGGIVTDGSSAPIDIHVSGAFTANNRADLDAKASDLSLHVHQAPASGTAITTDGTSIDAEETLTIRARGDVVLDGQFDSDGGTTIQSREGGISFGSSTFVSAGDDAPVIVEGSTEVRVGGGSYVEADDGDVTIAAYAGSVWLVDHASISSYEGDITVRSSVSSYVTEDAMVQAWDGDIRIAAHGGDVRIGVDDSDTEDGATIEAETSTSLLTLEASSTVWVAGSARVSGGATTTVRAYGGDYRHTSSAKITGDSLSIRAGDEIAADPGAGLASIWTRGNTGDLDLSAGDGGVSVDLGGRLLCGTEGSGGGTGGALSVITSGPVRLRGYVLANEGIRVATTHTSIDMTDAILRTYHAIGESSGPILVESWAQVGAVIDATRAEASSGSSTVASGDVTICARNASDPIEDPIEAFILPKKVKVKINADKPERSTLKTSGFFDLGPGDPVLTGPATLTVGGLVFNIPGLTPTGRNYNYDTDGVTFRIKTRGNGSSRAKFLIKVNQDLNGQIDLNGTLDIEFTTGDLTGIASVGLTAGRYRIGKTRGMLYAPNLYLQKARCKLKSGSADKLKLMLGLSTDGTTPAAASDVRVRMGTAVDVTIPAASFQRSGDLWVFSGNVGGITDVVLDYGTENITIKGKGLTLPDYPDGPNDVAVAVDVGADSRGVSVRMVRSGKTLKY
jgi:hypothetical protein